MPQTFGSGARAVNGLADGLYWRQEDNGEWSAMYARNGVYYTLETVVKDGELEQVPDMVLTVKGPLPRP